MCAAAADEECNFVFCQFFLERVKELFGFLGSLVYLDSAADYDEPVIGYGLHFVIFEVDYIDV